MVPGVPTAKANTREWGGVPKAKTGDADVFVVVASFVTVADQIRMRLVGSRVPPQTRTS